MLTARTPGSFQTISQLRLRRQPSQCPNMSRRHEPTMVDLELFSHDLSFSVRHLGKLFATEVSYIVENTGATCIMFNEDLE